MCKYILVLVGMVYSIYKSGVFMYPKPKCDGKDILFDTLSLSSFFIKNRPPPSPRIPFSLHLTFNYGVQDKLIQPFLPNLDEAYLASYCADWENDGGIARAAASKRSPPAATPPKRRPGRTRAAPPFSRGDVPRGPARSHPARPPRSSRTPPCTPSYSPSR